MFNMFRSKERRERIKPIVSTPKFGYLSVLLENLKLKESYRRLHLVAKKGIKTEEEIIKKEPKFGYGESTFIPYSFFFNFKTLEF